MDAANALEQDNGAGQEHNAAATDSGGEKRSKRKRGLRQIESDE